MFYVPYTPLFNHIIAAAQYTFKSQPLIYNDLPVIYGIKLIIIESKFGQKILG